MDNPSFRLQLTEIENKFRYTTNTQLKDRLMLQAVLAVAERLERLIEIMGHATAQ